MKINLVTPQKLGEIGENIILEKVKKEFPDNKVKKVSKIKESREEIGCDIILDNGLKIEVKTATRINGIPDACINEFSEEDLKFKPDFLYLVTVLDNEGNAKLTKICKEEINKYSHQLKKIVRFDSRLKTDLKNNKFNSEVIKIDFEKELEKLNLIHKNI